MTVQKRGLIFVISGPSGSGKTTLVKRLLAKRALKGRTARPISFTTRPKRPNEKEGRDYLFINEQQFKHNRRAKKILEWTKYLGYYYGTPKDYIEGQLKKNKHIIMCLDLKGARRIKRIYPKRTITIFIMPPSLEALRDRIYNRCNKTKTEEIRERIELAKEELLAKARYDYYLVNEDLGQVTEELKSIIFNRINI